MASSSRTARLKLGVQNHSFVAECAMAKLGEIVRESVDSARAQAAGKALQLSLVSPAGPIPVEADIAAPVSLGVTVRTSVIA